MGKITLYCNKRNLSIGAKVLFPPHRKGDETKQTGKAAWCFVSSSHYFPFIYFFYCTVLPLAISVGPSLMKI